MSRENVATTRGSITPLVIEAFNRGGVEEAPSKSWRPPATASGGATTTPGGRTFPMFATPAWTRIRKSGPCGGS
jgi:hypothetical protein